MRKHYHFTVRLSSDEKQKLEDLAERLNRTRGDALRQLLNGSHEQLLKTEKRAINGAVEAVIGGQQ